MENINRRHKDSLFSMLFGNKEAIIELYNAIEGTSYGMDADVQINTLQDVLYMERLNDLSFTINGKIVVLVEHQSTINYNMPLRFLMYIARVYEKILDNENIYRHNLIKIPTPEFIVLYNGTEPFPERKTLYLSEAFMEERDKFNLDLSVDVININNGMNKDIMYKSKVLEDYSVFIAKINAYRKQGISIGEAVKSAIKDCMNSDVLKEFLLKHSSEVFNMLMTEFNLEDCLRVTREESEAKGRAEGRKEGEAKGRKEGEAKGRKEGKIEIIYRMLSQGLDDNMIISYTDLTIDELADIKSNFKK